MSKILFSEIFINTQHRLVIDWHGLIEQNVKNKVLADKKMQLFKRNAAHIVELINKECKHV